MWDYIQEFAITKVLWIHVSRGQRQKQITIFKIDKKKKRIRHNCSVRSLVKVVKLSLCLPQWTSKKCFPKPQQPHIFSLVVTKTNCENTDVRNSTKQNRISYLYFLLKWIAYDFKTAKWKEIALKSSITDPNRPNLIVSSKQSSAYWLEGNGSVKLQRNPCTIQFFQLHLRLGEVM